MGKYQPKGSLVGVCGVKKNQARLATKQQQPTRRTKPSPEEKKHVPGKVKNLTRRRGSIREETCWLACKEEDLKEGSMGQGQLPPAVPRFISAGPHFFFLKILIYLF